MATFKHISSKNADYGAAEAYLTFEHDEFTMKPTLDENGRLIPREDYRISSLNCGGEDFAVACMRANLRYEKNQKREDVKSHHYIISFDPRDGTDNGLTVDRAQELGEQFCKEHFPGHQALICTHPDGHNHSGNIVKRKGKDYFENVFIHKFDSITTIGLLLTLVMIFSFQGNVILENPLHIVLIAIPLILQTFLIFAIAYVACRVLKLPYKIAAPAGMIGASNFFELAVAVAIALFGTTSPAALATTVGVLTEVPVMLLLVRIANKTKGRFPA